MSAWRSGARPCTPTSTSTRGLIYRALGLPAQYFTACFAMARVFGYLAHFMESRQDNRSDPASGSLRRAPPVAAS